MTIQSSNVRNTNVFKKSDSVAFRQVGDEVLLVPVRTDPNETSGVYTLNRTASFLWLQIDGKKNVAALASAVEHQFDVSLAQAEKDTTVFLTDLLSIDALLPVSGL